MKYTKQETEEFKQQVCSICGRCTDRSTDHLMTCPKIFNWKVMGRPDGVIRLSDY